MSEIIYGIHAVQALLKCDPVRFKQVYILKRREEKRLLPLIHQIEKLGIVIQTANRQWMDAQTENAVHQGVLAQIKPRHQYQDDYLNVIFSKKKHPFLLILDGITDPHNLGACLRSADAAGIDAVIIPKDKSAQLNAASKKVACGAAESIPLIRVTNISRILRRLQQNHIWVVGTTITANHTLYESKLTGSIALVMGSESAGIRRLTRKYCDDLIKIPMAGIVSSLNVSVATGIFLFEVVSQRKRN